MLWDLIRNSNPDDKAELVIYLGYGGTTSFVSARARHLVDPKLGNLYGANSVSTEQQLKTWLWNLPAKTLLFFSANSVEE